MFYLTNAFSINVLDRKGQDVSFVPVTVEAVKNLLRNEEWQSAVGHPDTAAILTELLGVPVEVNRLTISMEGNSLVVAQYTGPRLEAGAKTLPEGATIEFWQVYHA